MARTPTNQIPLGFKAIEFDLPDVITGGKVSLNQVSKKNGLVVIFICNHCPVGVLKQVDNPSNEVPVYTTASNRNGVFSDFFVI